MRTKRNYNKPIFITGFIISLLVMFLLTLIHLQRHDLTSKNSILDLSSYSFDDKSSYSLGRAFSESNSFELYSYNVYSLTVILPDDVHDISVKLPAIRTSYRLVINNMTIYSQNKKKMTFPHPRFLTYHSNSNILNMKLYIDKESKIIKSPTTNPTYSSGLIIGSPIAIENKHHINCTLELAVIIICFVSCIFHLTQYFIQNYSKLHLAFCLFSFSITVSFFFSKSSIIYYTIPNIPLILGYKIELISYCLRQFSFLFYIKESLRKGVNNIFYTIGYCLCAFITIASLISAPSYLHFIIIICNSFFLITIIIIVIAISVTKYYEKDTKQLLYSIGSLILLIGSFSDFAYMFSITAVNSMISYCLILFTVIQTCTISIDYQNSYANIKQLTKDLKSTVFELQNNKSTYISTHLKPSFLYETMDSINKYCGKDIDKTDKLIQALAKYLRQSLDSDSKSGNHPLKTELENCKAYAYLVNEQYPSIKIIFNIEENLPSALIPQLGIMTIIENSVTYAFDGVISPQIVIDAHYNEETDKISISITDNGIGMSQEALRYALVIPNKHLSIGLYYINQQLIDNNEDGLNISSKHRKGTSISFTLTRRELENPYEVF